MNIASRIVRKSIRMMARRPAQHAGPGVSTTYQPDGVTSRWYMHELAGYVPEEADFAFRVDADPGPEPGLIDRVIRYGERLESASRASGVGQHRDMWLFITEGHRPLRDAINAGDVRATAGLLRAMATGPLVAGFMNFEPYDRLRDRPEVRRVEATHFVDKLLSLAESVGCQPVQGIEQGERGYQHLDVGQLLAAVRGCVGFDLAPPAAGGGSFGFRAGDGNVYNVKDLNAIYTAHACARLAEGLPGRTVAEIGGGTGTLGHYLFRAGFDRATLFDLPMVSVIQAYFLMRSLGQANVWLDGEHPSDARVRVRPFWTLADEPDRSFALFVNQDSLPEIERAAAMNYLGLIKAKGSRFYSINQEGRAKDQFGNPQSVVYELAEASGGFRRTLRYPHWMRTGYVEESYDVVPA